MTRLVQEPLFGSVQERLFDLPADAAVAERPPVRRRRGGAHRAEQVHVQTSLELTDRVEIGVGVAGEDRVDGDASDAGLLGGPADAVVVDRVVEGEREAAGELGGEVRDRLVRPGRDVAAGVVAGAREPYYRRRQRPGRVPGRIRLIASASAFRRAPVRSQAALSKTSRCASRWRRR